MTHKLQTVVTRISRKEKEQKQKKSVNGGDTFAASYGLFEWLRISDQHETLDTFCFQIGKG